MPVEYRIETEVTAPWEVGRLAIRLDTPIATSQLVTVQGRSDYRNPVYLFIETNDPGRPEGIPTNPTNSLLPLQFNASNWNQWQIVYYFVASWAQFATFTDAGETLIDDTERRRDFQFDLRIREFNPVRTTAIRRNITYFNSINRGSDGIAFASSSQDSTNIQLNDKYVVFNTAVVADSNLVPAVALPTWLRQRWTTMFSEHFSITPNRFQYQRFFSV